MEHQILPTRAHAPAKYRLPDDRALSIRTNPPVNLTVMEGAAYLGISPRKLREIIQSRRVKFARLGARIILRREYLDELVRAVT